MIDLANTVVSIVKKSLHLYYEDKDMNYLLSRCINDDIPIIGIDNPNWSERLSVFNEHYQFYRQSENAFVVYGRLTIREVSNEAEHVDYIHNVTINCVLINNDIAFSSIHCSSDNERAIATSDNVDDVKQFYHEVFEKCYDVCVEYDNINNSFYYNAEAFRRVFEAETHFVNIDQMFWYICTECIHPDDTEKMDVFRNIDLEKRINNNECKISIDVRIKNSIKRYKWIRITILLFANLVYKINKIMFLIKDIDDDKKEEIENVFNSRIDSLTGVFNRRYSEALIKHSLKENEGVSAMLVFDVDDYKKINDTFGHLTGDVILKRIIDIITCNIDSFDIIGRFGGDEFVVFIRNRESEEVIHNIVEKIHKETQFEYEESGNVLGIHISMGVRIVREKNLDYNEVFNECDIALYKVKRADKNGYLFA